MGARYAMKSIVQQRIARGKFIKSFGPQIRMGMSMPRSLHEALMKEAEERCYPGINELIREILRVYVQEMESDAAKPDSTYESLQKEAAERQFPGVNEFIRDYLEKRESDRDLKHEKYCGKFLNSAEYSTRWKNLRHNHRQQQNNHNHNHNQKTDR